MKVSTVFISCAAGLALAACAPEFDNVPELDDDA
jgi:hypothetical protein